MRPAALKAHGPTLIPHAVLQILAPYLSPLLQRIFNVSLELGYCAKLFRDSVTVAMQKPHKDNYVAPHSWRFIMHRYLPHPWMSASIRGCIWPVSSRVSPRIGIDSMNGLINPSIKLPHYRDIHACATYANNLQCCVMAVASQGKHPGYGWRSNNICAFIVCMLIASDVENHRCSPNISMFWMVCL